MRYKQFIFGFFICILLELLLYGVNNKYGFWKPDLPKDKNTLVQTEKHEGGGVLTNPLLECMSLEEGQGVKELHVSKKDLTDYVNSILKSGSVNFISVYVRDLNNGPWIGINEDEEFIGGSLLKVPIMMSYMKKAENDPSILSKKILYDKAYVSNNQYFTSAYKMTLDKEYTIEDLLKYAIDYSDNNAAYILSRGLTKGELDDAFESLGMGMPDVNSPFPVNTKTYAAFFRVLFNSSFLNKTYSEKALDLLTKVEFDKGITKFIPKNIRVAHKFGIRTDGDLNQLHDCGIVYYPNHPYLICIMSKGGTFDNLADSIARISKFVYGQVSTVK